jgi:hypothetical protein
MSLALLACGNLHLDAFKEMRWTVRRKKTCEIRLFYDLTIITSTVHTQIVLPASKQNEEEKNNHNWGNNFLANYKLLHQKNEGRKNFLPATTENLNVINYHSLNGRTLSYRDILSLTDCCCCCCCAWLICLILLIFSACRLTIMFYFVVITSPFATKCSRCSI